MTVLAWAAIIKYYGSGDLSDRHLFLTILEARHPEISVVTSGEAPLPGLQMDTLLLPHMAESEHSALLFL